MHPGSALEFSSRAFVFSKAFRMDGMFRSNKGMVDAPWFGSRVFL
jgi:hypothetical protein